MKGDMRFTLPLWQMGSIFILLVLTLVIGFSSETTFVTSEDGYYFEMNMGHISGIIFSSALLILVVYIVMMSVNIYRHNKRYPTRKIKTFTFKPQEYIEDDEFFDEITKRATKKVYSYYSFVLPLLVGVALGGMWHRTIILVGILLVALGQYWIYYSTIRKMFKDAGEEE